MVDSSRVGNTRLLFFVGFRSGAIGELYDFSKFVYCARANTTVVQGNVRDGVWWPRCLSGGGPAG